jgi:hypothetical protein
MLFAYLGPDTFLPLTSIAAAIIGTMLMFGRTLRVAVVSVLRRIAGRSPATTDSASPGTWRIRRVATERKET